MSNRPKRPRDPVIVVAVSGGPDSVYLLHDLVRRKVGRIVIGHVNHGVRGIASDKDQELVEKMAKTLRLNMEIHKARSPEIPRDHTMLGEKGGDTGFPPGFEETARKVRHGFLRRLSKQSGAGKIALAHTADDQVETILMRVFEGAGISGLKGIPRETPDGIVRPILDVWKDDILKHLKEHKIAYRFDQSNLDTRFERNWVRNVLIPLLEKRYGKAVKKRLFTLGERFRELDDYLETQTRQWIRRNVKSTSHVGRGEKIDGNMPSKNENTSGGGPCSVSLTRVSYSGLPSALRIRILQKIGFDRLGLAPNERLLTAMDKVMRSGGPSARLKIGKGWELVNRYDRSEFVRSGNRKKPEFKEPTLKLEERGKITPAQAMRASASGGKVYFDAATIRLPLAVRPLKVGDRIRPFGLKAEKKVKEILIDRKILREERWGRPVICDAEGEILWIPGVVRSAHAPVTKETKRTVLLKMIPRLPRKVSPKADPASRSRK